MQNIKELMSQIHSDCGTSTVTVWQSSWTHSLTHHAFGLKFGESWGLLTSYLTNMHKSMTCQVIFLIGQIVDIV